MSKVDTELETFIKEYVDLNIDSNLYKKLNQWEGVTIDEVINTLNSVKAVAGNVIFLPHYGEYECYGSKFVRKHTEEEIEDKKNIIRELKRQKKLQEIEKLERQLAKLKGKE